MGRILVGVVVVAVVFTVYTAIDCALTPRGRVRGLPKVLWVLVALVLPVIGGVLWLTIGRAPTRQRRLGPDDDAAFLRGLANPPAPRRTRSSSAIDEELRQYEQELANLDGDADDDGEAGRRRD